MNDDEIVEEMEKLRKKYSDKLQKLDKEGKSVSYALRCLLYQRCTLQIERNRDLSEEEKELERSRLEGKFLSEAKKYLPNEVTSDFPTLKKHMYEVAEPAFELMEEYRASIKEFFVTNNLNLNAVRVNAPDEYRDGIIPVSKGLLTQYEEQKGDFVFASSTASERNAYLARTFGKGMYSMSDDTYFYPGDSLSIKNGRLQIPKTGYIYYMKCDDFMPVVTMRRDREGVPSFLFGEEWIIPRGVDLEKDVTGVEEFSDVTRILENIQAISSSDKEIISLIYSREVPRDRKLSILLQAVKDGRATYWNDKLKINPKYFGREAQMRENEEP